jgi:hypothetical protein
MIKYQLYRGQTTFSFSEGNLENMAMAEHNNSI